MEGISSMNDMLISCRAEIEAEAKLRGVHPEVSPPNLSRSSPASKAQL
jgi:hypothetical protein